jgi:hypothetical protein
MVYSLYSLSGHIRRCIKISCVGRILLYNLLRYLYFSDFFSENKTSAEKNDKLKLKVGINSSRMS